MSRSYKKQPYRASRRFDKSCRCHGSCPWCRNNRLYNDKRRRQAADDELEAWLVLAESAFDFWNNEEDAIVALADDLETEPT